MSQASIDSRRRWERWQLNGAMVLLLYSMISLPYVWSRRYGGNAQGVHRALDFGCHVTSGLSKAYIWDLYGTERAFWLEISMLFIKTNESIVIGSNDRDEKSWGYLIAIPESEISLSILSNARLSIARQHNFFDT